jgi:plasmid stabilization system protein ParE
MKLVFDDRALADLEGIHHRIAQDSPKAAKAVIERIFASTELLASSPYMGPAGRRKVRASGSYRACHIS